MLFYSFYLYYYKNLIKKYIFKLQNNYIFENYDNQQERIEGERERERTHTLINTFINLLKD